MTKRTRKVMDLEQRELRRYIGKYCDITMVDGTGGSGFVQEVTPDGWIVLDYGYAFNIKHIKSIKVIEQSEE